MQKNNEGLRYNKGKLRYSLIPQFPLEKLAEVYTKGAHKYSRFEDSDGTIFLGTEVTPEQASKMKVVYDAADNWRLGLSWRDTMDAVKRHIAAWEKDETIDPELGTLHLANAAWGLFSLMEFYKTYRAGDDRSKKIYSMPRIGLDVDEVICDFTLAWGNTWGTDTRPEFWNYDSKMGERFSEMSKAGTLDDFFLSLELKMEPRDLPFEPCCYVTSRPVDSSVTEKYLYSKGFPQVPVITVGHGGSKVEALKNQRVDIFVDDSYSNFVEINKGGILCYLWDAPHNRRFDVGDKRITSLKQIVL